MVVKKIDFYCKRCKKSLGVSYEATGDESTPVLTGVTMKCHTHKCVRVLAFKNMTEGEILKRGVENGKLYV